MAELFGRVDGTSGGRGGSMHIFDAERRFMGGYGIVGGNLPIAAGLGLASQYKGEDAVTVCMFGDGASNTGNFGETMNLAALWKLPVLFLVENNLYGMGTSVERHSAQTDLSKKAEGYGIPGTRIDGMDVVAVREGVAEGIRLAREEQPADPARGLHLPLPRPLRRRPRGLPRARGGRGVAGERPDRELRAALRRGRACWASARCSRRATKAEEEVEAAVEFAEASPEPALDTMYENLYVLDRPGGWYAVDERSPEPHRGEHEGRMPDAARELAEAGAAYAGQPDDGSRPEPGDRRATPRTGVERARSAREREIEGGRRGRRRAREEAEG